MRRVRFWMHCSRGVSPTGRSMRVKSSAVVEKIFLSVKLFSFTHKIKWVQMKNIQTSRIYFQLSCVLRVYIQFDLLLLSLLSSPVSIFYPPQVYRLDAEGTAPCVVVVCLYCELAARVMAGRKQEEINQEKKAPVSSCHCVMKHLLSAMFAFHSL